MPPSRSLDSSRPRRDPLSCHSCRVKKLRCDRQNPCGNCRSRRLKCEFHGQPNTTTVSPPVSRGEDDLYAQNAELRARMERLERAIFGESPAGVERESKVLSSAHASPALDQQANGATVDSQWLEGIGTNFVEANPHAYDLPPVTIHSGNDFMFNVDYLPRARPVSLPSRELALECLDLYEVDIDLVHPIVHIPTVRDMIHAVYDELALGRPVDSGPMALVLVICACVSLWELHDTFRLTPSNSSARPSEVLATQAMFAVDNAHVSSQSSIEAVQASILLCFHVCHLEGFSPHARGLYSRAFTMARGLGLHKIDAPTSVPRGSTQTDLIETEVGRKVWWHLAATDWLFGYTGGIHEGTYSIHPQHMAVQMPRNINHEDLNVCDSTFTRPDDQPTIMTYYLQRLKLAILCREIMDALAESSISLAPKTVPYDRIIALDTKYCGLVANLPQLFHLDPPEGVRVQCGRASQSAVWLVRTTIHLFLHARRCKLHLPYLIRVKSDPRYAYSREICLKSARRVFEAREVLHAQEPTGTFVAYFHLGGTLIHLFYAAMVLVMDLCVNSEEGAKDQERVTEVQRAMKIMENTSKTSPFVAKFLRSMMEVLRKHQVSLPATEPLISSVNEPLSQTATSYAGSEAGPAMPQTQIVGTEGLIDTSDGMLSGNDGLNDAWHDYLYNGASLDLQSWDALINDLEMRFE